MLNNKSGFTLIELVMIIIVLGILAAVAIPKYIDLKTDAEDAAIRGIYGGIQSAYAVTIASVKGPPTEAELEANLSGDPGTLLVNGSNSINNLNVPANTILGTRKTGAFNILVDGTSKITAITNLVVTP